MKNQIDLSLLKIKVVEIVDKICKDKHRSGHIPCVALYVDICREINNIGHDTSPLKRMLRNMAINGEIEWHRTINDTAFKLKDK